MKKIFKNYKQTIILLLSIIIGGVIGIIFKEKTSVLNPFGDLFINMMFIVIVPIIFLTITTTIAKMENPKRLGKIMLTILVVIIVTSLIAVTIGFITTKSIPLINSDNIPNIKEALDVNATIPENINILEKTISILSVNDFIGLFSRNNIIAILVFSIIFGFAIRLSKEKGKKTYELLESLNTVILNVLKIIMYYAPIGLGCYFASLVGNFGNEILVGYLKTFIIYHLVCLFVYIFIYGLYSFIAGKKHGLKAYFKNILPPTITALATCSSAASIPVNIDSTKKMGVSSDIAETMIPIGTNFHKEGSIIGSCFKIMFLVYLFGTNASTGKIILVALFATLLVTAVPVGGGTISETMILTLMGFPLSALPILTIIATIIDPGATVLNVVGDSAGSMLVNKIVNKKAKNKKE